MPRPDNLASNEQLLVTVIGAGVVGLSTAVRLSQMGFRVQIIAGHLPNETASIVAAAYWAPHWVGEYPKHWATETLTYLQSIAGPQNPAVKIVAFEEWLTDATKAELLTEIDEAYWWRNLPGIDFRIEPMRSAPDCQHCVHFRSVVVRMPDYLQQLQDHLHDEFGITVEQRWIETPHELLEESDVVVNCTGWAAKSFVTDDPQTREMRLLAGYVVRVPRRDRDVAVSLHRGRYRDRPLYLVPRSGSEQDMICGGTAIEIDETPDPRVPFTTSLDSECQAVWDRCLQFDNSLAGSAFQENLVALRPMRQSVRVEQDSRYPQLFHNYGHGGAGLTLSWGTAGHIANLVRANTLHAM